MKTDVITVTSDTTQLAALGTEAVAAIIANASPYKFEFHAAEGATGHTVVYAPTGSGMTQQFRPLFDAAQQAMTPEQATRVADAIRANCTIKIILAPAGAGMTVPEVEPNKVVLSVCDDDTAS
ncbi:MAG: hypothetical protein AB1918_15900 [Pseudomonadota bacterium]